VIKVFAFLTELYCVPSFLSYIMYRPSPGHNQPPIKGVFGDFSQGFKLQGREADHSPAPSAEVRNGGVIPTLSHTSS
jgi:hypothetical protein